MIVVCMDCEEEAKVKVLRTWDDTTVGVDEGTRNLWVFGGKIDTTDRQVGLCERCLRFRKE